MRLCVEALGSKALAGSFASLAMAAAASEVPHHVHAIVVVRQSAKEEATILGMAEDLTTFSYFTRGSIREAVRFAVRTIGDRVAAGEGVAASGRQGRRCHLFSCRNVPSGV